MATRRTLDRAFAPTPGMPGTPGTPASVCSVPGCPHWTSEGKPYCTDHLARSPYVARLLTELEEREAGDRAAASGRWQELDVNGSRAREITGWLAANGPQSLARLRGELLLGHAEAKAWVEALVAAELVRVQTRHVRRGRVHWMVGLASAALAHARRRKHLIDPALFHPSTRRRVRRAG